MKKNGEIKEDKRKESVSSSRSEDVTESEDFQSIYIPIKKEKSIFQIIDNKLYDKIVQHIKNVNAFQDKIKLRANTQQKSSKQNFYQTKFIKLLTN